MRVLIFTALIGLQCAYLTLAINKENHKFLYIVVPVMSLFSTVDLLHIAFRFYIAGLPPNRIHKEADISLIFTCQQLQTQSISSNCIPHVKRTRS